MNYKIDQIFFSRKILSFIKIKNHIVIYTLLQILLHILSYILLANQVGGFFKVYYFKKEVKDQFDFLHVYKHQSFHQVDTIVFGWYGSGIPK